MVVLESTTYPGTTEELIKPILEKGRIRTYANQYVSWQTTMSEVVEWIQQEKKGE